MIKIGNSQGFWGDRLSASATLLSQQPDLDYLTLDYLSEVSMSIMAIQKEKDPSLGYAHDFIEVIRSLIPFWKKGSHVKVITNAGGLNPLGCAQACLDIIKKAEGLPLKIGVLFGDDVLSQIGVDPKNPLFNNLETGESIDVIKESLATANVYLGARSISELLRQGADIVVTGRVADPSLTVGPCAAHFNWLWQDYDRLAGATVAGHLIECGTQVTGGISTDWLALPKLDDIGFPIVEVAEDGTCVVTKPSGTGGRVNEQIVKEQLLYEIDDPDRYLSPDVTVSFLSLQVKERGEDRVLVSGAKGRPPPNTLKVSATYRDGFKAEGMLVVYGPDVIKKARACGEIILKRIRKAGFSIDRSLVECLGVGDVVPGMGSSPAGLSECVLRICLADSKREALEFFVKELAPLVTCGPQGLTGYSSGRPHIRPIFGYWPCLIETEQVAFVHKIIE